MRANSYSEGIWYHSPAETSLSTIGLDVEQIGAIAFDAFSAKNYCVVANILYSKVEIERNFAHGCSPRRCIYNRPIDAIRLAEHRHGQLQRTAFPSWLFLAIESDVQEQKRRQ
jgi:hypothetical protein